MWFLAILMLFNAWANNDDFINTYRLNIFGMPANPIDGLVVVGVLIALFKPQTVATIKTDRMHPVMMWMLALFVLAALGGLVGATHNGATSRQILTAMRNFLAAPAALYLAYFLTANVNSSRRFLYLAIASGLMVSFMIVVFFREKSVSLNVGASSSLNEVRGVIYISAYAGLAVALLFYSVASGLKLFPLPLALIMMGVCLVGQIATLSRSDWLAAAAALMAGFCLLPKEQRMKSLLRSMLALPFLIASIWIGLYAASQVTGKDFFDRMEKRVWSMLPGDHGTGEKSKAWDTRLPGTFRELRMWASSPLIGGGFGIGDTPQMEAGYYVGVRHNTWSSTLSETGILGFAAFGLMAGGCVVIGRRMVKARTDQTTMLIGAFGIITATFFWFHGLATMSFNQVRWGLPFFITAGVLLRTRAMQLTLIRQAQEEQALEQQGAADAYDYSMEPHDAGGGVVQHPALGNWYQTN